MIISKIGKEKSAKFFEESQYVVALGSNDFINNYLMPVYSDSWTYNDQSFIAYLMETLEGQLRVSWVLQKCLIWILKIRENTCEN